MRAAIAALLLCGIQIVGAQTAGTNLPPDMAERLRAARLRARAHVATGDLDAAARQLQQVQRLQPADRYVLADLATVQRQRGQLDSAEAIYRQLRAAYPQDPALRDELAYLLFERERYAEVVALLSPLIDAPAGATLDQLQIVAVACDRSGQGERADALYRELLTRQPDDVRSLVALGERLLAADRRAEALPYLRRAHALAPKEARILRDLARGVGPENAEYEVLLLDALRRDRNDVEAPYLLGEVLYATAPARSANFYAEAERRILQAPAGDPYLSRLQARIRFRLVSSDAGLALYDSLIARRPGDVSLRLEVAELLLEARQPEAALARLPDDIDDARVQRTAGRAHALAGDWAAAARYWQLVVDATPADTELQLNLIDAQLRADRFGPALQRGDDLRADPRADVAERAYELSLEGRRRRGRSVVLEAGHTGLPDEGVWRPAAGLRWRAGQRGFGRLAAVRGSYRDSGPAATSTTLGRLDVEVGLAPRPGWEAAAMAAWTRGRLDGAAGLGARLDAPLPWRPGGRAAVTLSFKEPWDEPVDAMVIGGRFDRQQLTLSLPWGRWFISVDGRLRQFSADGGNDLGTDRRGTFYLSREVWRRPYGARWALRSVSLTAAHERSAADQPGTVPGVLRLPRRTALTTVGLYARCLWRGRAHLDIAPFVGGDPGRDLALGDVTGLSVAGQVYLWASPLAFYGDAFVASESRLQATGGAYRAGHLGLRFDLDGELR